jgi:hypothetical protein
MQGLHRSRQNDTKQHRPPRELNARRAEQLLQCADQESNLEPTD